MNGANAFHEGRYHWEAKAEVDEILSYYDGQDHELALSFLDLLGEAVCRVERTPDLYRKFKELYRKCHLKRFPFSVVYWVDLETDLILIVAVAHDSRKPGYWQSRF